MDLAIAILKWVCVAGAGVSLATAVLAMASGMPVCATVVGVSGLVQCWLALDD